MTRRKQDWPLEAVTYRPAEAAEAIGVGTTMMYDLINDGTVPHVLVGGFIRVPVEALRRWAEQIARSALRTTTSPAPGKGHADQVSPGRSGPVAHATGSADSTGTDRDRSGRGHPGR